MSHHTSNRIRTQQHFIHSTQSESDCLGIFNLLTSDILFEEVETQLPEHRERLFPPTETLAMFVTQTISADRSCQNAVNPAAIHRLINGLPDISTHTGGYCQARQRLPAEMISGLTRYLGQQLDQQLTRMSLARPPGTPGRWHHRDHAGYGSQSS